MLELSFCKFYYLREGARRGDRNFCKVTDLDCSIVGTGSFKPSQLYSCHLLGASLPFQAYVAHKETEAQRDSQLVLSLAWTRPPGPLELFPSQKNFLGSCSHWRQLA
jgi:hypothetical protein